MDVGHAEHVAPVLSRLLAQTGVGATGISRIGVTVGPGSFMGQRVGMAFAKGLALGTGADTVPMTTLHAIAASHGFPKAVAVDARRGEVYVQAFDALGHPADGPQLLDLDRARAWAHAQSGPLAGSGGALLAPERQADGPQFPTAKAMVELADKGNVAPLRTLYLRPPDAKPPSRPAL